MKIIPIGYKRNHALLYLFVNEENKDLLNLYEKHVAIHNEQVRNMKHPNSGFDIFFPEKITFENNETKLVNMDIVVQMHSPMEDPHIFAKMCQTAVSNTNVTAFHLYPRSSISKTPLILSNSVGIIDQGYRGNIMGSFRSLSNETYTVNKYTRMLQICHPSLIPIEVVIVNNLEDLMTNEHGERGAGGFGSSGLVGELVK